MALTLRYENILQGAAVLTGNTLTTRVNGPYPGSALFLTGAYISTNPALQVAGYPPGTTLNYLQNSSMAILNVIPGSTIAFAQLMWVGINAPAGTDNNPVNFTTPAGTTAVTPTLFDVSTLFWRAADVTALVQAGVNVQPVNGQYTVGAVPSQNNPTNVVITPSWGLIVVYENNTLPLRYININTGIQTVSDAQQLSFNFPKIITPTSGPVKGYLLMNYSNGDLFDGAQIRVGKTAGTAVQIGNTSNPWDGLAPYSRINNMFPGNLLYADTQDPNIGLPDNRGTFGALNIDPYTSTAPAAARNNYDIAGYNISNLLTNNQTNLYTNIRFTGTGQAWAQSQTVQVDMNAPKISPTKVANPPIGEVGDTLSYLITFQNTGLANADHVVVTDTIPTGMRYLPETLSIEGVTATVTGPNPLVITLDKPLEIGKWITIKYDVVVDTISVGVPVSNSAQVSYSFIPAPGYDPLEKSITTNKALTEIDRISFVKTADKEEVKLNEELTYTLHITNTGTGALNNLILTDQIPSCTTFVPGSVTINGASQTSANPANGIALGTLVPGMGALVTFTVRVSQVCCPASIANQAIVNYAYLLGQVPNQQLIPRQHESNTSVTPVSARTFKQLSKDELLTIPTQKPDAEAILNTIVDVQIKHTKLVQTILGTSYEGQHLTGYKLIIEGNLSQKIEYIALEPQQSVHSAHFSRPFSTYIILPTDFAPDTPVEVEADVEDIYTKLVDCRTVFKNVTFRLLVKYGLN